MILLLHQKSNDDEITNKNRDIGGPFHRFLPFFAMLIFTMSSTSKNVKALERFLIFCGLLCTLVVTPGLTFDPVNLPKMTILTMASFGMLPLIWFSRRVITSFNKIFISLIGIFIFALLLNLIIHSSIAEQIFWGEWGRNTGFLTYISLSIILLGSSIIGFQAGSSAILVWFGRCGYLVTVYALMQYLELDPVNWSTNEPVATLGNINFMSSFLGLVTVVYLSRITFENLSLTARTHFLLWSTINILTITASGSLQGIAMIVVGVFTIVSLHLLGKKRKKLSLISILGMIVIGLIIFIGTLGIGPLGKFIVQQTVLFRVDYWQAGINMFLSNWTFGVGLDSYGDFYRQYRSLVAVERTGPQRVTNTAHNIFIDLFSGGGILLGSAFLLLYISILLLLIFRALSENNSFSQSELPVLLASLLSSSVFYLISIHQIGVGVWIIMILGLAIGFLSRDNEGEKTKGFRNKPPNQSRETKKVVVLQNSHYGLKMEGIDRLRSKFFILLLASLGFVVCLPPLKVDSTVLNGLRTRNLLEFQEDVFSLGAASFHTEKMLEYRLIQGEQELGLKLAQRIASSDPRNFFAWSTIATSTGSSEIRRKQALDMLLKLDPQNVSLERDVQSILDQGDSLSD